MTTKLFSDKSEFLKISLIFFMIIFSRKPFYITHLSIDINRDQSRNAPSQWESSLQCNDVYHWLCAYLEWSLHQSNVRVLRGFAVLLAELPYFLLRTLRWRHNDHGGVSNHQPHGCLLNCFFRRRSKKTSKLRVTGLCAGNSSGPVNSPHKGPVTRKMVPFDDVIMKNVNWKQIVLVWAITLLGRCTVWTIKLQSR